MVRESAALLVALTCPIAARASDAPAGNATTPHWKYDNPFCSVVAEVVPLGTGARYGLALFADRGTTLAAHVTLVSDTDAYDANVPDTNLLGSKADRKTQPIIQHQQFVPAQFLCTPVVGEMDLTLDYNP